MNDLIVIFVEFAIFALVVGMTVVVSRRLQTAALTGRRLRGEAKREDGVSTYAQERFAGQFRRAISLPDDVDPDRVDATCRDGIVRVSVAKRESAKPRQITVN